MFGLGLRFVLGLGLVLGLLLGLGLFGVALKCLAISELRGC